MGRIWTKHCGLDRNESYSHSLEKYSFQKSLDGFIETSWTNPKTKRKYKHKSKDKEKEQVQIQRQRERTHTDGRFVAGLRHSGLPCGWEERTKLREEVTSEFTSPTLPIMPPAVPIKLMKLRN